MRGYNVRWSCRLSVVSAPLAWLGWNKGIFKLIDKRYPSCEFSNDTSYANDEFCQIQHHIGP